MAVQIHVLPYWCARSWAEPELFFFYKGPEFIKLRLCHMQGGQKVGKHMGAMLACAKDDPVLLLLLDLKMVLFG